MTYGRHFEEPTAATLPNGATTWNDKSLHCSFLLLPFFFFFSLLLPSPQAAATAGGRFNMTQRRK